MKAKNYLDKEKNIEESKKYKTYTEFRSGCKAAYYIASSNGWLSGYDKKSMGAYIAACKNGWQSDYTWLKRAKNSPKGNKFEEALEKLNSEMVEICPEKPKTFYRDKDIMQMLQVSKSTLKKYIKGGYIGYTVVCGKRYYRESDLEEFLFKNHVPAFAYEKGKTKL